MLPQTLPIRFLLNRRADSPPAEVVRADGAQRAAEEGREAGNAWEACDAWAARHPRAGRVRSPVAPGAIESVPTPLKSLGGLGKALGLETLWFKEGPETPGRNPSDLLGVYAKLVEEILQELDGGPLPTHVFLQAGTGEMAAAVAGHLWDALGDGLPRIIVVEPANADCVLESALASRPTPDSGSMETNMVSLARREVSPCAWAVLKDVADAFLSISDYAAEATVALLKGGVAGDPTIFTRPSGAAGLAGLIAASFEPSLTGPLRLGSESRVLVLGWEGPA